MQSYILYDWGQSHENVFSAASFLWICFAGLNSPGKYFKNQLSICVKIIFLYLRGWPLILLLLHHLPLYSQQEEFHSFFPRRRKSFRHRPELQKLCLDQKPKSHFLPKPGTNRQPVIWHLKPVSSWISGSDPDRLEYMYNCKMQELYNWNPL